MNLVFLPSRPLPRNILHGQLIRHDCRYARITESLLPAIRFTDLIPADYYLHGVDSRTEASAKEALRALISVITVLNAL